MLEVPRKSAQGDCPFFLQIEERLEKHPARFLIRGFTTFAKLHCKSGCKSGSPPQLPIAFGFLPPPSLSLSTGRARRTTIYQLLFFSNSRDAEKSPFLLFDQSKEIWGPPAFIAPISEIHSPETSCVLWNPFLVDDLQYKGASLVSNWDSE